MGILKAITDGAVRYSRVVIVVLLLVTVVVGAGAPMITQSSSLDSFQSGTSEAAHAQEYVSENFTSGEENTTAVQIIIRGENVLSKASLQRQLKLQQKLRANGTVNATLANDSTVGVGTIISTVAVQMDRAEALKARANELEHRGESLKERGKALKERATKLNESKSELKQRSAQLKRDGKQLKQRGQQLKARAKQLNESRTEIKQKGKQLKQQAKQLKAQQKQLKQKGKQLKQQAKQLKAQQKQLEQNGKQLKARAQQLNESRQQLREESRQLKARAQKLKADQAALKADAAELQQRAKALSENRTTLKQRSKQLKQRAQSINETRESLEQRAKELKQRKQQLRKDRRSGEVPPEELKRRERALRQEERELANDTAALEQRAKKLKADRTAIERDAAKLQQRAKQLNESRTALNQRKQELKQRAKQLNESRTALEQQGKQLEQQGKQLKAQKKQLEQQGKQLKQQGKQLKAEQQQLEQQGKQLEQQGKQLKEGQKQLEQQGKQLKQQGKQLKAEQQRLEQQGKQLEQRTRALKNDSEELKQRGQALKNDSAELKEDQKALERAGEQLKADQKELQNSEIQLSLSERIDVLESHNSSEIQTAVEAVLGGNSTDGRAGAFAFMPTSYEPGDTEANATMLLVTQQTDGNTSQAGVASDQIVNAQLAAQEITHEQYGEANASVFGAGIITDEINRSMTDSLTIVGPLALLFVLVVLVLAYRDLLDILLGVVGIAAVLVWTFGFMGWTGIAFNQIFIAVPVLLIGLSIDYAIHVFMRHREARDHVKGVANSMRSTLGGLSVALVLVTLTAVIGFLSNLTSSVPPIREFGVVSAVGITSALVVFGLLIPALKVELDGFFEAHGFDRNKRAVGTGGGALGSLLSGGATAAKRAPHVVLLVALVLTVAGGVGASQVNTSFAQEDFLADDPPEWMESLPEPFAPSEYSAKDSLSFVNDQFVREDSSASVLIRGNVTAHHTLTAIDRAERNASNQSVTATLSNGDSDIQNPLSVMESVAANNESFNKTFKSADTDGDGVPDQNVSGVYDSLYDVAPDRAQSVIYRTEDGQYEALQMTVSTNGDASGGAVTDQMRAVAASIEQTGQLDATATGQPIVFKIVQDRLLQTVIESLLLTLAVTFVFLMFIYRYLYGSASLGFVTLLPVVFSVAWILGTMYLLSIPFNMITGLITSLTIGLGIAYSIHLSERYSLELGEGATAWQALQTAVTGTGGALLGSAATTVGGFGVLAFAILPPLQQFGIITGLTIIYAFLASVVVLPSLLILWTRWLGPSDAFKPTSIPFKPSEKPFNDD